MSSSYLKFFHVPVERFAIIGGPGHEDCKRVFEMIYDEVEESQIPQLKFTLSLGSNNEFPVFTNTFRRKLKFERTYQHTRCGFWFITHLEGHKMNCFYNFAERTGWLEVARF